MIRRWRAGACALVLLCQNACSGDPATDTAAAISATPLADTTVAAAATSVAFPLKLSENGRYLIDQNGAPFLINQASSWGLIQSLSTADATGYLNALQQRGFNTVLVSIISNDVRMAGSPPNWRGISPFRTAWDYSTYEEAYFAHADEVIDLAMARGMLVMLVPSYLGYAAEPTQGWNDEMMSANNSVAKCLAYGRFLGKRYKDRTNMIWVAGGDNTPPAKSELERRIKAIMDGIRESDSHLWTAHWDSVGHGDGVMSTENSTFTSYMSINGYYAYDYNLTYVRDLDFYNKQPPMMLYHLDQSYEGEPGGTVENIRRKAYDVMLMGGAGSSFCAGQDWWSFYNWRNKMDTPGGQQTLLWYRLFSSRAWYDLVPDQTHTVVTSGLDDWGSTAYVVAARTASGSTAMAFLPTRRTVTVDLAKISGARANAWWYSPESGQSILIGTFATTSKRDFTPPTDSDWLLVVDDAARNFAPPGSSPLPSDTAVPVPASSLWALLVASGLLLVIEAHARVRSGWQLETHRTA